MFTDGLYGFIYVYKHVLYTKNVLKVIKDIENVKLELKRMDERRKQEGRDKFNDKELKKFKELRIKLAKLESKQIEKQTKLFTTKNNQSKQMGENMKIFLSDQINHINKIKRGLLDLHQYQSELYQNCDMTHNS